MQGDVEALAQASVSSKAAVSPAMPPPRIATLFRSPSLLAPPQGRRPDIAGPLHPDRGRVARACSNSAAPRSASGPRRRSASPIRRGGGEQAGGAQALVHDLRAGEVRVGRAQVSGDAASPPRKRETEPRTLVALNTTWSRREPASRGGPGRRGRARRSVTISAYRQTVGSQRMSRARPETRRRIGVDHARGRVEAVRPRKGPARARPRTRAGQGWAAAGWSSSGTSRPGGRGPTDRRELAGQNASASGWPLPSRPSAAAIASRSASSRRPARWARQTEYQAAPSAGSACRRAR